MRLGVPVERGAASRSNRPAIGRAQPLKVAECGYPVRKFAAVVRARVGSASIHARLRYHCGRGCHETGGWGVIRRGFGWRIESERNWASVGRLSKRTLNARYSYWTLPAKRVPRRCGRAAISPGASAGVPKRPRIACVVCSPLDSRFAGRGGSRPYRPCRVSSFSHADGARLGGCRSRGLFCEPGGAFHPVASTVLGGGFPPDQRAFHHRRRKVAEAPGLRPLVSAGVRDELSVQDARR